MEVGRNTVCKECLALWHRPRPALISRASVALTRERYPSRSSSNAIHTNLAKRAGHEISPKTIKRYAHSRTAPEPPKKSSEPVQSINLNQLHSRILELSNSVLKPTDTPIPSEQRVLYVLEQLDSLCSNILDDRRPSGLARPAKPTQPPKQETATSALLGSVNTRPHTSTLSRASLLLQTSELAEAILRHPHVFITPAILHAYITLQTLLGRPESFPDIFDLYAHKPIPRSGSSSETKITFSPASPNKISSAVAPDTASLALRAATTAHDLPLALEIITTTLATRAFARAKILRKAGVPLAGVAAAPAAAYALATSFAAWQPTMDPATATAAAFAGIITYAGAVGTVGYVAVTTANDQMTRVTWATGVPLWERWVREEERAAVDAVAVSWGFADEGKRGEEEGEEWESFREWVGLRGMVLDRVSLMEGME